MLLHLIAAKRGIWTPILRRLEVYFITFSFFLISLCYYCYPNIKELDMTENVLHFSVFEVLPSPTWHVSLFIASSLHSPHGFTNLLPCCLSRHRFVVHMLTQSPLLCCLLRLRFVVVKWLHNLSYSAVYRVFTS